MDFYISFLATENKGLIAGTVSGHKLSLQQVESAPIARGYVIKSHDGKKLYALSQKGGTELVACYDITADGIKLFGTYPIPGGTSCHLTQSPDGKFIFVANYGSGTIDILSLETGETQTIKPSDNGKMHMVSFRPDSNELFAVDLGRNCIDIFDFCDGNLSHRESIKTKEGGPRHLVFSDSETFYLIYEFANLVDVFTANDGHFLCRQSLSTLPENCTTESFGAAIKLLGNKLYVSNRGHDSIMAFDIEASGLFKSPLCYPLEHSFPRDFSLIDENHMLVSFQKSNQLVLYEIGDTLSAISTIQGHTGAICVCL